MDNLPDWPGAAVAYSRAYKWMQVEAARAWRKTRRDKGGWRIPDDVETCIRALDTGDEETIKALNLKYLAIWAAP